MAEGGAVRVTRLTFGYVVLLGNSPGETRDPNIRIHCRRHVTSNQPGIVPDVADSVGGGVGECSYTQPSYDGARINVRAVSNSLGLFSVGNHSDRSILLLPLFVNKI